MEEENFLIDQFERLQLEQLIFDGVIPGLPPPIARHAEINGLPASRVLDATNPYGDCNDEGRSAENRQEVLKDVLVDRKSKRMHDGFDDLRDLLENKKNYCHAQFEEKFNSEDERPQGVGLMHMKTNCGHLVASTQAQRLQKDLSWYQKPYDKKQGNERNFRRDTPDAYIDPDSPVVEAKKPILYRVIDVVDDGLLLCESVFAYVGLCEADLQFVVLQRNVTVEGPHFRVRGFNSQFVDVNDLVWIYDVVPLVKTDKLNEAVFDRAMYRGREKVLWSSKAHKFLRSGEFKTAYGYVINDRGDAVITGSDEVVSLSNTAGLVKYLGGIPKTGDMFQIDYVNAQNFDTLLQFTSSKAMHAGFDMVLKPARRDETILVVGGVITTADFKSMVDPFQHVKDLQKAIEFQTRGYAVGKFTDAVVQQLDADAVVLPATIQWFNNGHGGQMTVKREVAEAHSRSFSGAKLATVVISSFEVQLTLLVKLEATKYSNKRNMVLCFQTFSQDRDKINEKIKEIKRCTEVNISPIEQNPTDDVIQKYLFLGNMRRQLRAHLLDDKPMNSRMLRALRDQHFTEIYDFDDSYVQQKPFKYCGQDLTLDIEQSTALDFISHCDPASVVIEACAGAGKTLCSVALMVETMKMYPNAVQFMCAPTNRAVDNMANALSQCKDARPIRLFSKTQLDKFDDEPSYSMSKVIEALITSSKYNVTPVEKKILQGYVELLNKLQALGMDQAQVAQGSYHNLTNLKIAAGNVVNNIVVARYKPNVILTTVDMGLRDMLCSQRASICKQKFKRILIDEASQLDEPRLMALLSLNMHTEQVVLVGDPRQLPPYMGTTITPELRRMAGSSALDAAMRIDNMPVVQLHVGYRMHKALLALTSTAFYECELQAADVGPWKSKQSLWKRLNNGCPVAIGLVGGQDTRAGTSTSNELEAKVAEFLVRDALKNGVNEANIGVICLYNAQVRVICRKLANVPNVEVASVDSFQGREKDYIIVCTSRSTNGSSEFFSNVKRANVATSRAILGMVILGERYALSTSAPWRKILDFSLRFGAVKEDYAAQLGVKL